MVYKNTLEAIIENVKEIENLVSEFAKYKKIPAVEMDLTLEKVRNLYDILLLLKKSGQEEESVQASQDASAPIELPPTEEAEDIKMTDKTAEDAKADSIARKEPEETIRQENEEKEKIVSDRFKSESASIHDSISKLQQYDDLSSKLQTKPISNIADAIGINEKFTFIKELFDGDAEKYNDTIDILNKVINFNDAYNYLMGNFNWDMDSPLVQKILNLIRRKLIINKDE
jgi:hypothetical protein